MFGQTLDPSQIALQYGPADQTTRVVQPGTASMQPVAIMPSARGAMPLTTVTQQQILPGGAAPAAMTAAPACLSAAQIMAIAQCIANPGTADCAALATPTNVSLSPCPDVVDPGVPTCKDDALHDQLAYCDKYGATGPDQQKNALCWAATKASPSWYAKLSALPNCPGSQAAKRNQMLMWGGIAALIAIGGGVLYYTTKKKG